MKKILIILPVIGILFLLKSFKKMDNKILTDTEKQNLFEDLVKFTLRMEGGISDDKTDTASVKPLVGVYTVNGKTYNNPHTNKGITYKTYLDSSNSLGYVPSNKEFLDMPNYRWLSIFKNKYYSKAKNFSQNEVLNSYLSLWYWGGWDVRLMPVINVANVLASNKTNNEKLKALTELRKQYFDNIVKKNPTQIKYLKGWKKRADDFYNEFNKYT